MIVVVSLGLYRVGRREMLGFGTDLYDLEATRVVIDSDSACLTPNFLALFKLQCLC
jgi:hypothetical protein